MRRVPADATQYSIAPLTKPQAVHIAFEPDAIRLLLRKIIVPYDVAAPVQSLIQWENSVSQAKIDQGATCTSFKTDGISISMVIATPGQPNQDWPYMQPKVHGYVGS